MIYILIFLGLLLSIFSHKYNNILFLFFSFILIFIGCFRAQYIGIDTAHGYKLIYDYFIHGYDTSYLDKGWIVINKLAISLNWGYQGVLIISELLCVLPVVYVINKESKNKCLSLFIYYASFIYLHSYNMIRQCIAMSFCLLAFYFFIKKKNKLTLLSLVVAFLFHKSSLVFIPFFLLMKMKINFFRIVLLSLISLAIGLICNESFFIKLAGPYSSYLTGSSFGFRDDKASAIVMSVMVTVFFIMYVYMMGYKNLNQVWLKTYFFGVCFMNVTVTMSLGTRIIYYYTQTQILFFTDYLVKKKKEKYIYFFVLFLYYTAIFYKIFFNQYNAINPYKLFFL